MVLKFVSLFDRLFPKGKAWEENQENITQLKEGMSDEFGRVHTDITTFYQNFNIINKYELANFHGLDYGLNTRILTNRELQHIIVQYIYGNIEFKDLIEDFANFIGATIEYINPNLPFIFGSSQFGDTFGDSTLSEHMELLIRFDAGTTCSQYVKLTYIVNFFKPPYLKVTYSEQPLAANDPFIFGSSQFGDKFKEIVPCTL